MTDFQKLSFCVFEAVFDGFLRVSWEIRVSDNELMKVISEEFSSFGPTMPIINSKEGAFRPDFFLPTLRFHNV
jgi:hypothetical protein